MQGVYFYQCLIVCTLLLISAFHGPCIGWVALSFLVWLSRYGGIFSSSSSSISFFGCPRYPRPPRPGFVDQKKISLRNGLKYLFFCEFFMVSMVFSNLTSSSSLCRKPPLLAHLHPILLFPFSFKDITIKSDMSTVVSWSSFSHCLLGLSDSSFVLLYLGPTYDCDIHSEWICLWDWLVKIPQTPLLRQNTYSTS